MNLDPDVLRKTVSMRLSLMHVLTMHGYLTLALKRPEARANEGRAWAEDVLDACEDILLTHDALSAEEIASARADRPAPIAHYTCPHCCAVSFNRNDRRERYCGACHTFEEGGVMHGTDRTTGGA